MSLRGCQALIAAILITLILYVLAVGVCQHIVRG